MPVFANQQSQENPFYHDDGDDSFIILIISTLQKCFKNENSVFTNMK